MLPSSTASTRPKRVLLVDAVVWSSKYPEESPFRNVHHWYSRWLTGLPEVTLEYVGAEADILAKVRTGVDGVILSGSPRSAWDGDPVNLKLCDMVHLCRELAIPFLGVCYGHQVLARALGAVVGPHQGGLELGNTPVELTPAGRQSPLFAGFPDRFDVLSSHADTVLEPPPDCEVLVRGGFTSNQGFGWKGLLLGVQFHPEMDPETLRFIWGPRIETWQGRVSFDLEHALANMCRTPLAGNVLRNFVTRVIP